METEFIHSLIALVEEMAPYLLLGFLIAGIMHAFVPTTVYRNYLGKGNTRSVVNALLFGIPLPLCSCGVIPTAIGMHRDGASKGATTAFLIGTPQTGIDSILATYSVLGLPFALVRPLAALLTGMLGGICCNLFDKDKASASTPDTRRIGQPTRSFGQKCVQALDYAFTDMLVDIGRWLVFGLLLAGLITIFVPDNFFVSYRDNHLLNMLLVLLIASPMYVCATGSIPIAAALMLKGLSPGAALVFLMAGPATNMASILVLDKTLGRRTLVIYLLSILVGSVATGYLIDTVLPTAWFSTITDGCLHDICCHSTSEATPWWKTLSAIIFGLLLIRSLFLRYTSHKDGCECGCNHNDEGCNGCCSENSNDVTYTQRTFRIEGMMCNHCRLHVQQAIENVEGVESVTVDLPSGTAIVRGSASDEDIIQAVTQRGYSCKVTK